MTTLEDLQTATLELAAILRAHIANSEYWLNSDIRDSNLDRLKMVEAILRRPAELPLPR